MAKNAHVLRTNEVYITTLMAIKYTFIFFWLYKFSLFIYPTARLDIHFTKVMKKEDITIYM